MSTYDETVPRPGETWKWEWVWVSIVKVGPKMVFYRDMYGEVHRSPRDSFLARFHRTLLTEPTS